MRRARCDHGSVRRDCRRHRLHGLGHRVWSVRHGAEYATVLGARLSGGVSPRTAGPPEAVVPDALSGRGLSRCEWSPRQCRWSNDTAADARDGADQGVERSPDPDPQRPVACGTRTRAARSQSANEGLRVVSELPGRRLYGGDADAESRVARYGATSREVADWLAGQAAVFQNCSAPDLVLPVAAPPWADRDLVADREYQIAVAYFYATRYDEAARRFRAIAENSQSPWRSVGRYLAARAMIRAATVPDEAADRPSASRNRLEDAQRDLELALEEPAASAMHPSARGLLDFVAGKLRPVERLHEVSRRLATVTRPTEQDFVDFTWLKRRTDADTRGR